MIKINYQKQLDEIIKVNTSRDCVPSLLLHSCCAPCSSYCLEYLSQYFNVTIFYFNPNIYPEEEYRHRVAEQQRLISQLPVNRKVGFIEGEYNPDVFYSAVKGLEHCREGGERCFVCYRLRLEETAKLAKKLNFDYFTTTLTISPLKNSQKINEIAFDLSELYGVSALPSDFKKKEGYKRSIELSRQYDLYRQNFCGCVFSKRDAGLQTEKEV